MRSSNVAREEPLPLVEGEFVRSMACALRGSQLPARGGEENEKTRVSQGCVHRYEGREKGRKNAPKREDKMHKDSPAGSSAHSAANFTRISSGGFEVG
jgi:hypothetical protein